MDPPEGSGAEPRFFFVGCMLQFDDHEFSDDRVRFSLIISDCLPPNAWQAAEFSCIGEIGAPLENIVIILLDFGQDRLVQVC